MNSKKNKKLICFLLTITSLDGYLNKDKGLFNR